MEKKKITLGILVGIVAVVCIYLIARPKLVGSMKDYEMEKKTGASAVSFEGKKGERVKFEYESVNKGGKLFIALYDSENNLIHCVNETDEPKSSTVLPKKGLYILSAEYEVYTGEYQVKAYK